MGKRTRKKKPSLLHLLAAHRRSSSFSGGLIIGLGLLGAGVVLLLLPVIGKRDVSSVDVLSVQDLTMMIFGSVGFAGGILLLIGNALSQLAHELLLRLDDDYNRVYGTDTEGEREGVNRKSADSGLSFHSPSKSELRKLSTRDLTAGWRLLVMVPLVVGALLLALSIVAWQVPRLGNLVFQCGVRLEYLGLGGLVLMMIGAYLMPLGGIVCRRASKHKG